MKIMLSPQHIKEQLYQYPTNKITYIQENNLKITQIIENNVPLLKDNEAVCVVLLLHVIPDTRHLIRSY